MSARASGVGRWALGLGVVALAMLPGVTAFGQDYSVRSRQIGGVGTGQEATGEARVTVAPPTTQEVVAEGKAAIGVGGVLGARKAAEAQALRNAVEKAIGVFVSARSLTQNYVLVRDQVLTKTDGYATLKEVLKEEIGPDSVTVTVRATVSLKPLAEGLKTLGLTRAWRVYITTSRPRSAETTEPLTGAIASLEATLTQAGFPVVSSAKDADITITVVPRFTNIAERPVTAGNVPMIMYSERGDLTLRAVRTGTGEVVAALSGAEVALHIEQSTARTTAATDAMGILAPKLADSLLVLPAAQSQPVALTVSGFGGIRQVGKVEEALGNLPGVRNVVRRSYSGGVAVWELDVFNEGASTLAENLETFPALRPFGIAVSAENKAKITATLRPASSTSAKRTATRP